MSAAAFPVAPLVLVGARTFNPSATLPEELTDTPQWICWHYVVKTSGAEPSKVPCSPTGGPLDEWQKNRAKWMTYEQAVACYESNLTLSGIGFVLTPELGIVGVDMDHVIDVSSGEVAEWAIEHVRDFDSYAEVSPSRTGLRLFVLGTLPNGCPKKRGHREIYNNVRWLTVTGRAWNDSPILARPDAITRYLAAMAATGDAKGAGERTGGSSCNSNADLIRTALSGDNLHDSTRDLAFRLVDDGLLPGKTVEFVRGVMKSMPNRGDPARWKARYADIPKLVNGAVEKTKAKDVPKLKPAPPPSTVLGGALPDHPDELLVLPYGLGQMQEWILGRSKYPSPSTAGITALAVLAHFAMGHVTVDSYDGLGLNGYFMVLAPTGFGKEDLRSCFAVLDKHVRSVVVGGKNARMTRLPGLQWSAPASLQGIHQLLQKHSLQTFVSDEFAEWLTHANNDSHKQMALGYFMELYTKHHSSVNAPHAVTREYSPVESPRVGIFATSTAERMLSALTGGQADSGAYNRFVMHVAEQDRIPKRYTGMAYAPSAAILSLVDWIVDLPVTVMAITPEAWTYYMQHDADVIEPGRFSDNALAARLSEQAFKFAALIALSDRRTDIGVSDLVTAYAIREGIYRRAATLIGTEGAISGMHATGKALEQLTVVFSKHGEMRRAWLPNYSRAYKALTTAERNSVVNTLITDGTVKTDPKALGMLFAGDVDVL